MSASKKYTEKRSLSDGIVPFVLSIPKASFGRTVFPADWRKNGLNTDAQSVAAGGIKWSEAEWWSLSLGLASVMHHINDGTRFFVNSTVLSAAPIKFYIISKERSSGWKCQCFHRGLSSLTAKSGPILGPRCRHFILWQWEIRVVSSDVDPKGQRYSRFIALVLSTDEARDCSYRLSAHESHRESRLDPRPRRPSD